jgi:hypothetical protein
MRANQPKYLTKDELRRAATCEFKTSKSAFDFGWMAAIEESGRHDGYEPLRNRPRTTSQEPRFSGVVATLGPCGHTVAYWRLAALHEARFRGTATACLKPSSCGLSRQLAYLYNSPVLGWLVTSARVSSHWERALHVFTVASEWREGSKWHPEQLANTAGENVYARSSL